MRRSERNKLRAQQQPQGKGQGNDRQKEAEQRLSPEALVKLVIPIMRIFDDGLEHDAQIRFQKLLREHGAPKLMDAIAQSDLPEEHRTAAAKFALEENRNDALNNIIFTLNFVPHDRHGKLTAHAEPLALYLTALQRREEAVHHALGNGQNVADVTARVNTERPNLIPALVKLRPGLGVLFPDYTPPKAAPEIPPALAERRAAKAVTAPITAAKPAPVAAAPRPAPAPQPPKQVVITVNGAAPVSPTNGSRLFVYDPSLIIQAPQDRSGVVDIAAVFPWVRREVAEKTVPANQAPATQPAQPSRTFQSVRQLQRAIGDLIAFQQGRLVRETRINADRAVELIDAYPQFADDKIRNERGQALILAGRVQEAVAYFEGLVKDPRHAQDSFTHVMYSRALRAGGRAKDAVVLLAPLVAEGGFMQHNAHGHIAQAYSLSEADGADAALAFLDNSPLHQDMNVQKAYAAIARRAGKPPRPADAPAQGQAPAAAEPAPAA
jgi:hypothetical protein